MIKKFTRISALIAGFFFLQNNVFANANNQNGVAYCTPTISNNQVYLNWVDFSYNSADVTGGISHFNTGNTGYYTSTVGTTSGTIKRGCGAQLWLSTMTTLNSAVGFKVTVYGDWNNDGDFTDANELSNSYSNTIPAGSGAYMNYPVTVYVPYNANQGNVRLRFVLSMSNASVTPCGSVNGEVEDYLITIADNKAPVLNTAAVPVLNNISTDQTATAGIKVKSLIESSKPTATLITDGDGCPKTGVAVTGTTGAGTWQYLRTTGTWTNISSVSSTNALLLQDSSSIRYVPSGVETATITVKAWDQTSGTDGSFANVSTGGTTTAFSINSVTINQVVVAGASYTSSMNLLSYGNPNKIASSSFDRTNKLLVDPTVLNTDANFGYGTDLELDEVNSKIYWCGTGSTGNDIYTAKADGTNPTVAFTNGYAMGLAYNNGKIYSLQYDGLFSANVDGSGITAISGGLNQLVNADISDVKDIDYHNSKLYFIYQSAADSKWHIKECNLDGTGVVDKYSSTNTIYNLDVTAGNLYWAESDGTNSTVYKRTISGTAAGTLVGTLNGTTIFTLKADEANTTIYASTYEANGTSKVYRIPYAGSSFTKLLDLDFPVAGLVFPSTVVATPAITSTATLSTFTSCSGTVSGEQSFTVSGTDLTANLVATAPAGYEVSLTSVTGFASSVNIVPTTGVVSNKTVYVRLTTAATGTPSGNIVLSSTGATDKTVALTGTVSNTPSAPSLTSVSRCSTGTVSFTQAVRLNAPAPYKLYDAAVNGNVVGSSLTTPSISQTTDFWATITTGACESARTKVTATVKQPSATILNETACDKYFFNGVDRSISGTYTQTLTNKVGCDSVVTLNLVINVSPSAPNLTSTPICGTGSVTFSTVAPTRLNTLVSPNKLYNAETAGSVVGTGYTTPSISQTTEFWATQSINGCESPRVKVTATVKQPSASSLSETACDSYVFGSKTLTQSGVYKDTIPNAVGCDSVRTLNLTINTTPTMPTLISNPICNSGTVTFNEVAPGRLAAITPYRLYNASVNGNVVGNALTTPTISQTTDFWATVTLNGCESARKKVTATVNPLPTVSITVTPNDTINEGESITLAGNGAVSYTWNNDITDNVAFNPTLSGLYKVVGKDANNCTNADSINIVVNKLTAIESSNSTNFSIYPNPASDNVTITLTESVSGTISIVDLKGNVVATKSISGNTSNISTADLASGVYVVKISSDKGVAVKQLVIQ